MRISDWSSDVCSSDLLAQKYFRKRGLPLKSRRVPEDNVPAWLWRSAPDHEAMADIAEDERFIGETSAKQVFHRMAGTWTYWGWRAAISMPRRKPAPTTTRCAICWHARDRKSNPLNSNH